MFVLYNLTDGPGSRLDPDESRDFAMIEASIKEGSLSPSLFALSGKGLLEALDDATIDLRVDLFSLASFNYHNVLVISTVLGLNEDTHRDKLGCRVGCPIRDAKVPSS